jgi:hypothetical protein
MPDAPVTPDTHEGLLEPSTRELRLTAGLAPTAEVSGRAATTPASSPCYKPCAACGAVVLTGQTPTGQRVALDTGVRTYVVEWSQGELVPRLVESRGYPMHRCFRP